MDASNPTTFDCPRCGRAATEAFYGPCSACREDLRRTLWRSPEDVEAPRFEPTMHVVPNQVATKE